MGLRTMKRRRRENRTDYKARRILLESDLPRVVVRRTNRYFVLQLIESSEAQDKVLVTMSSKELLKNDWDGDGNLKSVPAGYLTGVLFARRVKDKIKKKCIIDLGMARTLKGGRVFAVVKGLVDGGLDVDVDEKVFPSDDRLSGEHLKDGVREMIAKVKEELG